MSILALHFMAKTKGIAVTLNRLPIIVFLALTPAWTVVADTAPLSFASNFFVALSSVENKDKCRLLLARRQDETPEEFAIQSLIMVIDGANAQVKIDNLRRSLKVSRSADDPPFTYKNGDLSAQLALAEGEHPENTTGVLILTKRGNWSNVLPVVVREECHERRKSTPGSKRSVG